MKQNVYKVDVVVKRCMNLLCMVIGLLFCANTDAVTQKRKQSNKATSFDKIVQECKKQTMRKNFQQVLSAGNLEAFKKFVSTSTLFDVLVYNDQEWFSILQKLYEQNNVEMTAFLVNNGVCFDVGEPDSFIEYLVKQEAYTFLFAVLKKLTFSGKKMIQSPRNLACFFKSKCPNDLLPYITEIYPFDEEDEEVCEGYADLVLDMFDCDDVQDFDQVYETFFESLPTDLQDTLLERVVKHGVNLQENVEPLLLIMMQSPVHEACTISDCAIFMYPLSKELVTCVVEKLDNINAIDACQGKTALMIACEYGYDISVLELLAYGADPNILCTREKKDALLYASASKKNNAYTCIQLLLTMDNPKAYSDGFQPLSECDKVPCTCNVHRKDCFGKDALYYIFQNYSGKKLQHLFQILVQRDPELTVNCVYPQNETLLLYACKNSCDMSLIQYCFERTKQQCNMPHKTSGYTPLLYAVGAGDTNVVKYLLDNGAKAHSKLFDGSTIFHEAAQKDNVALLRFLYEYANVKNLLFLKNKNNETAYDVAKKLGKIQAALFFYDMSEPIKSFTAEAKSVGQQKKSQQKKQHKKSSKNKYALVATNKEVLPELWAASDKYLYHTIGIWWEDPLLRMIMQKRKNVSALTERDEARGVYIHTFPFAVDAYINTLAKIVTTNSGKVSGAYIWGMREKCKEKTPVKEKGFFTFAQEVSSKIWFHRSFMPCQSSNDLSTILQFWQDKEHDGVAKDSLLQSMESIVIPKRKLVDYAADGATVILTEDERILLYPTQNM